jgi:hypothetical protein
LIIPVLGHAGIAVQNMSVAIKKIIVGRIFE